MAEAREVGVVDANAVGVAVTPTLARGLGEDDGAAACVAGAEPGVPPPPLHADTARAIHAIPTNG